MFFLAWPYLPESRRPRRSAAIRLAIALLILTATAGAGAPQSASLESASLESENPNMLINHRAPAFVRNDLAGRPVRLNALRGRVVLLNFWATWCAPCQSETPRFIAWQRRYGAEGFVVIGVSMDDDAAPVRAFQHRLGVPYPLVMGDEKLGLLYGGVLGLPTTYLIDRDGVIRARLEGETDLEELEGKIRKLLAVPANTAPVQRSSVAAHSVPNPS